MIKWSCPSLVYAGEPCRISVHAEELSYFGSLKSIKIYASREGRADSLVKTEARPNGDTTHKMDLDYYFFAKSSAQSLVIKVVVTNLDEERATSSLTVEVLHGRSTDLLKNFSLSMDLKTYQCISIANKQACSVTKFTNQDIADFFFYKFNGASHLCSADYGGLVSESGYNLSMWTKFRHCRLKSTEYTNKYIPNISSNADLVDLWNDKTNGPETDHLGQLVDNKLYLGRTQDGYIFMMLTTRNATKDIDYNIWTQ